MDGLVLLERTELYNMLQQSRVYPCLTDPNYILLLDTRKEADYSESHIITAKKATREETGKLTVPYNAELGCKQHVVVYDSNTNALKGQVNINWCCALSMRCNDM